MDSSPPAMSSGARGAAWYFRKPKDLKRLAALTPNFHDRSEIHAFVTEGSGGAPWSAETARAAMKIIHEASESDERLDDGVEYRFFVGGVACRGVETYEKLIATAATCGSFRAAVQGDPSEHGAAPWVALLTECRQRKGGLVKGPAVSVVGASRDETFEAAAQAAVRMFECGASGPTSADLQEVLKLCYAAGARCPLDTKKIESTLATRFVEEGAEAARELGAGTEDVAALTAALGKISVWQPCVNTDVDPHVGPEALSDITALMDAVKAHHASSMIDAEKAAKRSRDELFSL